MTREPPQPLVVDDKHPRSAPCRIAGLAGTPPVNRQLYGAPSPACQGQLDAGADELIQFVLDGVARMNALIRDLLAYARAGESEGDSRKPVSVKESLQEALWNLQAATAECGATVTQDELPTIRYNPRRLTQVFQNLVGNALKYRRQVEPPRIYISVHRRVTDWVFSVRDNGIGFDAEEAERIFEVFRRLHGPAIEGTGIWTVHLQADCGKSRRSYLG